MENDQLFKERFGIATPICYAHGVEIEPHCTKTYRKKWKRFWNTHEMLGSQKRLDRFDAFLDKIATLGDDLPYTSRVSIRFVNDQVGYGVFAKENISPYSILNQYGGVLKSDDYIESENDSSFTFSDFGDFSIEAQHQGNWCRFMNHSPYRHPKTNVVAWEHYSDWGPKIIFTACHRGIKKGEQLLYSYGDDYWVEGKFVNL